MIYLCIPIALLLFHSLHSLSRKHLGKEPVWLRFYAITVLMFILFASVLVVNNILLIFTSSGVIRAFGMLAITLIILLLFANKMPKKVHKNKTL